MINPTDMLCPWLSSRTLQVVDQKVAEHGRSHEFQAGTPAKAVHVSWMTFSYYDLTSPVVQMVLRGIYIIIQVYIYIQYVYIYTHNYIQLCVYI